MASFLVVPGYNQIAIQDFEATSEPEWESGDESVAWVRDNPDCFFVGTIDDLDGDVLVEMRVGNVDVPGARQIFEGNFQSSSGIVSVSGPTDDRVESFLLPRRGPWKIRIAVSGAERPNGVAVFFAQEEWDAALRP
jgi:hypothetical protein